MTRRDIEFAVKLASTAGWGFRTRDFDRILTLEPDGCFIATYNGRRAGMLTTAAYGRVGWIGNVIVDRKCRRKGVGSRLVEHAVHHLKHRGASTVGLYAYAHAVPFYEPLGFKLHGEFTRMSMKAKSLSFAGVRRMTAADLSEAAELDEACVEFPRGRLLEWRLKDPRTSGYVAEATGKLVGYIMREKSSSVEIGPWVCMPTHAAEASNLLKAAVNSSVGRRVLLGVPKGNARIRTILEALGFKPMFEVVSMFHETTKPLRCKPCLLAMESLERG